VHRIATRTLAAIGVGVLVVAACSGSGGSASSAAKTAKAAADLGGIDKLVEAAKAEGTLNVIALPPDWANYGKIIEAFKAKYGLKVVSDQPDGTSADEVNTAKNNKGTDAAPDVFDLGVNVALANTDLFAPYKVANWADIPDNLKDPNGTWFSDYAGFVSVGCDAGKVAPPAKMADLLDPKYKGMVALNGDPTTASAGFHGVVLAALANGGSADDLKPGVDFFKQLADAGNLLPVDPSPATIKSGQTPCVIDWEYNNAAQTNVLKGTMDWKVTIPSDAAPVAAYYIQAINKDAPHPAAARLWEEYLYSPEGSNGWIQGFARPATLDAMQKAGTVDAAALGALSTASGTPVVLTQDQITKGQEALKGSWNFISIK
jgi:putative spermidine/putrescine transport system substrate-binding protein